MMNGMRGAFLLAVVWLAAGASLAPAADTQSTDSLTSPGLHEVLTAERVVLKDKVRDKQLLMKIYAPKEPGKYPLIVFSHGMFGSMTGYAPLARHWTSHGYVCLHPTHADSLELAIANGEKLDRQALLRKMPGLQGWESRQTDIKLILDSLDEIERQVPVAQGKIDRERIGMGGHSFGAFTSQLVWGATISESGKSVSRSFNDPRPKAFLLLSPQGQSPPGLTADSWKHCRRPMLTITGDKDRGRSGQGPEWRKQPFRRCLPGDKYLLFIHGADHGLGGITGARERARRLMRMTDSPEQLAAVQAYSLTFWNAYLKNDAQAKQRLQTTPTPIDLAVKADFSRR